MRLPASLLAHNLANPCFGREPKARVVTKDDETLHLIMKQLHEQKISWKLHGRNFVLGILLC